MAGICSSKAVLACAAALLLTLGGSPAAAQTRQAEATVTVERSVGVAEISRMVFNAGPPDEIGSARVPGRGGLGAALGIEAISPAVIQISGDPGRAYRINLPETIGGPETNGAITGLTVWSENAGDITETLSAHMDDSGRDTLRISGFLPRVGFTNVSAAVPITVNYE